MGTNPTSHIGIEGRAAVELPRADYRPRPLDDRTELILRIESVTPVADNFRYNLHYMGLEAGDYSLAEFLVRPDGSRPVELEDIRLAAHAMLPEDHDGRLTSYLPRRFPFLGGYRMFLGFLTLLWVGGIGGFVWSSRRRRVVLTPARAVVEPSFAERLRPLVEAASRGELNVEDQARLERLLTGYWRDKLRLPEQRMADALAKLKAHLEAGELLSALERWLHRPAGASPEQINSLLAPYRDLPVPEPPQGENHSPPLRALGEAGAKASQHGGVT